MMFFFFGNAGTPPSGGIFVRRTGMWRVGSRNSWRLKTVNS